MALIGTGLEDLRPTQVILIKFEFCIKVAFKISCTMIV